MTSTLRTKVVAAARIAGFVVRLLAASLRDWSCWSLRHAPKRVLPPRTPTTSFGLTVTPLPPRPRRASSTMDRAEMADTVGQITGYQSTKPQITALAKASPARQIPDRFGSPARAREICRCCSRTTAASMWLTGAMRSSRSTSKPSGTSPASVTSQTAAWLAHPVRRGDCGPRRPHGCHFG
jgi:hypothetical protein